MAARALGAALAALVAASCGGGSSGEPAPPLSVGAGRADITPVEYEVMQDLDGNHLWDASSELFEDVGVDRTPSPLEPGYDPLTRPDPAGDDFHPEANPSGTEGNGVFDAVWIGGFSPARPVAFVHDPLEARALAFRAGGETAVIVSVDSVGFLSPFLDEIHAEVERRTGLARSRLVVAATHDHEAPDALGIYGPSDFETGLVPRYLDHARRGVVRAVERALADLRPARVRVTSAPLDLGIPDERLDERALDPDDPPLLAKDLRLPSVREHEVLALQAVTPAGATIATLVGWANHPEATGPDNNGITADFPGALRRRLDERLGGTTVYLTGALGGLVTPLDEVLVPYWSEAGERGADPRTGATLVGANGFDKARSLGFELADQVERALDGVPLEDVPSVEVARRENRLPLENVNFVLPLALGIVEGQAEFFSDGGTLLDFDDARFCGRCGCVVSDMSAIRLGDRITIATAPGELFPEYLVGRPERTHDFATPSWDYGVARFPPILGLREMLGAPEHLFLAGLGQNELGYLIPESDFLVVSLEELLFGGGPGSVYEHPNFYADNFSLGPRAGDLTYCDLVDLLDLAPGAEVRELCRRARESGPGATGAQEACAVVRSLDGPPDPRLIDLLVDLFG